jgi:2-C-methyl-D-erythritol 4-phosphate cytidylyltransferase
VQGGPPDGGHSPGEPVSAVPVWAVPVWAIVVAGGSGTRFGGYKQFMTLAGREVVDWSLDAATRACAGVVLVVPAEAVKRYAGRASSVVAGGPTRAESVRSGLREVPSEAQVIVVHDAARPLSAPSVWAAVIAAVEAGADAAVPCVPVSDTIKQRQDDGRLVTLERAGLLAVQTPQAFSATVLRAAHAGGGEATDDAALVEAIGGRVVSVPGEVSNIKVTAPVDLALAETLMAVRAPAGGAP